MVLRSFFQSFFIFAREYYRQGTPFLTRLAAFKTGYQPYDMSTRTALDEDVTIGNNTYFIVLYFCG